MRKLARWRWHMLSKEVELEKREWKSYLRLGEPELHCWHATKLNIQVHNLCCPDHLYCMASALE